LVAIEVEVRRAHARIARRRSITEDVALGRLDLDHVGTHVAEDLGRVRAHGDRGEVDHPDSRKRPLRLAHVVPAAQYGTFASGLALVSSRLKSRWMRSRACRVSASKRNTRTGVVLEARMRPKPSGYSTRKPSIVRTSVL